MEADLETGDIKKKKKSSANSFQTFQGLNFYAKNGKIREISAENPTVKSSIVTDVEDDFCLCMSHVHTGTQLIGMINVLWNLASVIRCFAATPSLITCTEGALGFVCSIILLTGNQRNLWLYYVPFLTFETLDIFSWIVYGLYLILYDAIDIRFPLKLDQIVVFKSVEDIDDIHRLFFGILLIFKSVVFTYMIYVVARGLMFLRNGGRFQKSDC